MATVYLGGTEIIPAPRVDVGRPDLDFGQGFYVTEIYSQAESWAQVAAKQRAAQPIVNAYTFDKEAACQRFKYKLFPTCNQQWLDFIVRCRRSERIYLDYDLIEGPVANDKVIESVRLFMSGFISADECLRRLTDNKPNHQLCIINQELINDYLKFENYSLVETAND